MLSDMRGRHGVARDEDWLGQRQNPPPPLKLRQRRIGNCRAICLRVYHNLREMILDGDTWQVD